MPKPGGLGLSILHLTLFSNDVLSDYKFEMAIRLTFLLFYRKLMAKQKQEV